MKEGGIQPGGAAEILRQAVAGFVADPDPADPVRRQYLHYRQAHDALIQRHHTHCASIALRLLQQCLHRTQLFGLRHVSQAGQEFAIRREQ